MGSISSTLNSINASLLSEIQAFSTSGIPSGKTSPTEASASPDQVGLSQAGTLFRQLQQLQTSNPAEFKQVLTDAAAKLQAAAAQQTNPNDAAFLDNLSSKFQTAASTGDLSALHPQSPSASLSTATGETHGHRHGHHGGGADNDSNATSSSQTAQDALFSILSSLGNTQNDPLDSLGSLSGGSSNNNPLSSGPAAFGSNSDQIQNLLAAFLTSNAGGSGSV